MAVAINDLGTLRLDGELLARVVGSPLEQLLFAGLALTHPEPLSTDRLLELLWPGEGPKPRRLWTHVFRLKRALSVAGHGEISVSRQGDGYALTGSFVLDSDRFDDLLGQAEARMVTDRARDAAKLLEEALGLWRGRPLGDMDVERLAPGVVAPLGGTTPAGAGAGHAGPPRRHRRRRGDR